MIAVPVHLYDPMFGLVLLVLVSIWNFIVTLRITSFFNALFGVLFQSIALWVALATVNRFIKAIKD